MPDSQGKISPYSLGSTDHRNQNSTNCDYNSQTIYQEETRLGEADSPLALPASCKFCRQAILQNNRLT